MDAMVVARGSWAVIGLLSQKTEKVLCIKRFFKLIEKLKRRYVLETKDVKVTWIMEEYRLTKKKKHLLLTHLLRRW